MTYDLPSEHELRLARLDAPSADTPIEELAISSRPAATCGA